jgi:hypothetical protein
MSITSTADNNNNNNNNNNNEKLFLFLNNQAPFLDNVCDSGGIAPPLLTSALQGET